MERSKINFRLRVSFIYLTALLIAGCIYIPPIGRQFTEETQSHIVVGRTTKKEVIDLLGKPALLENEKAFVYERSRDSGTLIVLLGIIPVPLNWNYFRLLLEFDENHILERYQTEAGKLLIDAGIRPIDKSNWRAAVSSRRALFEEETSWLIKGPTVFEWVGFSKTGNVVAAGDIKDRVWIQYLGTLSHFIRKAEGFKGLAISPDGTQLALLHRTVKIIDVAKGNTVIAYQGHGVAYFWSSEGATCVAFHPLKPLVATGGKKGYIKIWNPTTGDEHLSFKGQSCAVSSIGYSPDGRLLATVGHDGSVKLWNAETGKRIGEALQGREKDTFGEFVLKFSPVGDLLAINTGTHVEIWRLSFTPELQNMATELVDAFLLPYYKTRHYRNPLSLDISNDGRLVAASNGAVVVFDISNQRKLIRVTPTEEQQFDYRNKDEVNALAFSPDDKELAVATYSGVYLWRLPKKTEHPIQPGDKDYKEKQ